MTDDVKVCWFCKREPATESYGWCDACAKAMAGVTLVPNAMSDEELVASLREQVRTLTAAREAGMSLVDAIATPAGRDFAQAWEQACLMLGRFGSDPVLLRTLTAANAALVAVLQSVEHIDSRNPSEGMRYCPACGECESGHSDGCALGHALHGASPAGAALLAEMEGLRKEVARLTDLAADRGLEALNAISDNDALRARLAELEAELATVRDSRDALRDERDAVIEERDTDQQRAKALEGALAPLLPWLERMAHSSRPDDDDTDVSEVATFSFGDVRALEKALTNTTPEEG